MPITVGTLGRLITVDQRGGDIVFSFESSDLIITPLLPNVIRHTWVPKHWRLYAESVSGSDALGRRVWPAAPRPTVIETAKTVQVKAGELLIEAPRNPFHLSYSTMDGMTFLEELPEGGLWWSYWDYALRFKLAPEDHFYGVGQVDQLDEPVDLDRRGHLQEVWKQHSPPVTVLPTLHSLRGYGLLVDNPRRATWDLGHSDSSSFFYRARGGALQYYVFFGPDLPRLLRTYLELTGFPPSIGGIEAESELRPTQASDRVKVIEGFLRQYPEFINFARNQSLSQFAEQVDPFVFVPRGAQKS
jgi:alpha-glucosidase (family GH31 glycosyl hydrolase)